MGFAERRFRPRVAADGEEVSLSDADAYDRFMGRYSRSLAVPFADFAGLPLDGRVLDVGCGPGALTAELGPEGQAGTGHGGRPVRGIRRGPTRPPSRSKGHPRAG